MKKIKKSSFHIKVPKPEQVMKARHMVVHAIEKRGTKYYSKHREKAEAKVMAILEENEITGTSTERYWYLTWVVALIGKSAIF
jgi:hypothetical protein